MHGGSRRGSRPGQADGQGKAIRLPGPAPDPARLTRLLEPVVHALNMDLEGIRGAPAGRRRVLRVTIDTDGGVSLDDIALASRELSTRLDRADEMGDDPYTLEVSSPGLDRPLKKEADFRRFLGKRAKIRTRHPIGETRRNFSGTLVAVGEGKVRIDVGDRICEVPLDAVEKAHLVFDFKQ